MREKHERMYNENSVSREVKCGSCDKWFISVENSTGKHSCPHCEHVAEIKLIHASKKYKMKETLPPEDEIMRKKMTLNEDKGIANQPVNHKPVESEPVLKYITNRRGPVCPHPEECPLSLEFSRERVAEQGLRLILTPEGFQRVWSKYLKSVPYPTQAPHNNNQESPSFDREAYTEVLFSALLQQSRVPSECPMKERCLDLARCALLGKTYPYLSSRSSYIPPIGVDSIKIGQSLGIPQNCSCNKDSSLCENNKLPPEDEAEANQIIADIADSDDIDFREEVTAELNRLREEGRRAYELPLDCCKHTQKKKIKLLHLKLQRETRLRKRAQQATGLALLDAEIAKLEREV